MRRPKKSKYKSVVINKKRYYYYKITWIDPIGDSGMQMPMTHGLIPSTMITHAYLFDKIENIFGRLHLTKKMMNYLVIEMYFQLGV